MKVQATQRFWSELPTGKHRLFQKGDVFETSLEFKDFPDGAAGPLMVPADEKQAVEYTTWRKANIGRILREREEKHVRETMLDRIKAEAVAKVRAEIEAEVRAGLEAEMVPGGKRGGK